MGKSRFSIFQKEYVIITVIAAILTFLVVKGFMLSIAFLNPVERAFHNFHMTDLFCEIEDQGTSQDTSEIITIVDMTKVYSRARLAEIVNTIDSIKPAIVGVDIVFDGLRDDPVGNERLTETVYSTSSPIIWAYELTDWNKEKQQFTQSLHSFFTTPEVPLEEAYINVQRDETGGNVRSLNIKRQAEDGHIEYSMPARLAAAYTGDSTVLKKYQSCNIRYTSTHFPVVPCDSIAEYAHLIRNNIVLLGAANDRRDMHYTPMGHIAGVRIIAYAIQTIINKNIPGEIPMWMTILLTLFFMWACEVLLCGVNSWLGKRRHKWIRRIGQYELINEFIIFPFIVVLVWIDYLVFAHAGYYFNTTGVMMGILLLDVSHRIIAAIRNSSHLN